MNCFFCKSFVSVYDYKTSTVPPLCSVECKSRWDNLKSDDKWWQGLSKSYLEKSMSGAWELDVTMRPLTDEESKKRIEVEKNESESEKSSRIIRQAIEDGLVYHYLDIPESIRWWICENRRERLGGKMGMSAQDKDLFLRFLRYEFEMNREKERALEKERVIKHLEDL